MQESKGDYRQDDIAKTKKISKEEKNLVINKKKGKTLVPLQKGVQKRRRRPKSGKFQLKIKHTEGEEMDEEQDDDDGEQERPDSGFSSRAGTDNPHSLVESPAKEEADGLN